jgi:hypothetical protein
MEASRRKNAAYRAGKAQEAAGIGILHALTIGLQYIRRNDKMQESLSGSRPAKKNRSPGSGKDLAKPEKRACILSCGVLI